MSPPTVATASGGTMSAEGGITVQTTDHLIRDTNLMLSRAGLRLGPSKVARLARSWLGPLSADGDEYVAYLAAHLRLTVRQRHDVAEQYRRVIAYADPTGETAVANVLRGA